MFLNLPTHVAIIPDGNRRWAKQFGKPAWFGHQAGAKALKPILLEALKLKIPYFTFWGCSVSNVTKRDKFEVAFLFKLFELYFKKLIQEKIIYAGEIRVRVLGEWNKYFPAGAKKVIKNLIEKTKNHNKFNLTFMLAYSGTEELLAAVNEIAKLKTDDNLFLPNKPEPITSSLLKHHLYTKDLPPVDLIVRTGGEPHLSAGFMMWDAADAQLYFTDTYWPAFTSKEFGKAIEEYGNRKRRRGE